jgi:hypothetical protein
MSSIIIDKILARIGQPDLLNTIGKKLSGAELNSILLEAFRLRTLTYSPAQLLRHYQNNRFVKPADTPVLKLKQTELDLLKVFAEHSFLPLELSPVTSLGACSVVALADQKKILSALRGTEVMADAANAMALHICDMKKSKAWIPKTLDEKLRLSTIQRHVRTQSITGRGFTPHFKIGCLVTAGLDTGNFSFEKDSLLEQIFLMKKIFKDYYKVDQLSFRLLCRKGYPDCFKLPFEVSEFIQKKYPDIHLEIVKNPEKENGYYKGIQYKVDIKLKDKIYEIGDGGFVDWTQQLLGNKKERFLITGFGFEFMYRIMNGLV